jgi:hypothetical protein
MKNCEMNKNQFPKRTKLLRFQICMHTNAPPGAIFLPWPGHESIFKNPKSPWLNRHSFVDKFWALSLDETVEHEQLDQTIDGEFQSGQSFESIDSNWRYIYSCELFCVRNMCKNYLCNVFYSQSNFVHRTLVMEGLYSLSQFLSLLSANGRHNNKYSIYTHILVSCIWISFCRNLYGILTLISMGISQVEVFAEGAGRAFGNKQIKSTVVCHHHYTHYLFLCSYL